MKTWKEIGLGALKVIGYASATAATTALVAYLQDLTKTEQGAVLIVINALLYVLVQIVQPKLKK